MFRRVRTIAAYDKPARLCKAAVPRAVGCFERRSKARVGKESPERLWCGLRRTQSLGSMVSVRFPPSSPEAGFAGRPKGEDLTAEIARTGWWDGFDASKARRRTVPSFFETMGLFWKKARNGFGADPAPCKALAQWFARPKTRAPLTPCGEGVGGWGFRRRKGLRRGTLHPKPLPTRVVFSGLWTRFGDRLACHEKRRVDGAGRIGRVKDASFARAARRRPRRGRP
jgi:hypothetical protein